jgi:hypothetical protein
MTSTPTSALPKSTDEVPKFKVVILGKQQQQNGEWYYYAFRVAFIKIGRIGTPH